jgi:serine/threonine protein kinase/Flp pilus assembly protein TadD
MRAEVSHLDLLTCLLVRQQQVLSDEELEQLVRQWCETSSGSLLDFLALRTNVTPTQLARLRSTAGRQAGETLVDPLRQRLKMLPAALQQLLAPGIDSVGSSRERPTVREADTRPATTPRGPQADSAWAAKTDGLTPGDRFDALEVHAQGGLGVIYRARDREFDRTVALKQIKAQWADDVDSRNRFLLEARVTGRLEHPGVVPIYALGADASGRPYYAMRLIRGESLLEVIDRFHRSRVDNLTPAERLGELRKLLQRLLDVCHAVDYAHSKGVIHRDIKPSNIMLGKYGETLVVDWGLAKVIGSSEDVALTTRMVARPQDGDPASTVLGAAIGTPAYMSPEQAAGKHDQLTPTTDVYSLGATLYQLLTGCLPHDDDGDQGVMIAKAENERIVPPRQYIPWAPRPLESICLKALAANPADRYLSAHALAADIEQWLADEPVSAHAESWNERAFRWIRNHRTLTVSLAILHLAATVGVVAGMLGWSHIQSERRAMQEERDQQSEEQQRRQQQQTTALAASAQATELSALAELAAGRFDSALQLLSGAVRSLKNEDQLSATRDALAARRDRVRKLVVYHRAGVRAEELAYFQRDAPSRRKLYEALDAVDVFSRPDWWNALPDEDLSPQQHDALLQDVYRKLILLAAVHSKDTYKNLLSKRGSEEAEAVLAVNEMVQRFRPAESTRWHASCARMRLGRGVALSAADLAPPENPSDAFMLAGIWVIASQNPQVASLLARDGRDPLEACQKKLELVEALAPGDYWSCLLGAYVEMLRADETPSAPLAERRIRFERARELLSRSIAVRPDYWLAYAERSASWRAEIEARRDTPDGETPPAWQPTDELVRLMLLDSRKALELAGPRSEAVWYEALALDAAGRTEEAIEALGVAVEQSHRFDVETKLRLVDAERQRGLPLVLKIADRLLEASPQDARCRLLRAAANLQLDRLDEASNDVEAVLQSDSPPPTAWSIRGEIRRRRGDFVEAARDFRKSLDLRPDHAVSLLGLAACEEAQGDHAAALSEYERALKCEGTTYLRAAAGLGRARSLLRLGRPEQALKAAIAARQAEPSCELDSVLALAAEGLAPADFEAARRLREMMREPSVLDTTAGEPAGALGESAATLPLADGGFELGLVDHWLPFFEEAARRATDAGAAALAETTERRFHGGKRSLHVAATSPTNSRVAVVAAQTVPADPRRRYRLSLWVQAEGLQADAVAATVDDRFETPIVPLPDGTYEWRRLTGEFDLSESPATLREGLKSATVQIVVRGAGEAWIDDVEIEEIGDVTAAEQLGSNDAAPPSPVPARTDSP